MDRPHSLLWRILGIAFLVQFGAVVSLMVTTRVRMILRGRGVEQLPRVPGRSFTLSSNNEATVYVSGAALFDDMLAAIDGATERILFESYIIKSDAIGRRFKRSLQAAAARGVDVHVIYDGFANLVVRSSFFDFGPGVQVLRYPLFTRSIRWFSPRNWGRDHRKILVVDERIGFVGGYNIGDDYETEWRDTHVSLVGPAVWDLENAFIDFWNANVGRVEGGTRLEPKLVAQWETDVRSHRNVPAQLIFPIRGMYLEAIDRASTSIDITQAYFIPDRNILEALVDASQRGVRVRILIPKISNHVVADWVSRSIFTRLLEAGVEIWRFTDHMVHAKTMTIDGQWTTIGTANVDRLSLTGNYEINLELHDQSLATGMVEIFENDLQSARLLTLEHWRSRNVVARIYERILRPLRPIL